MRVEDRRLIAQLILLWLGLLLLAHLTTAFSSTLYADTEREHSIPAWPPSRPLAQWFERVWFAPFERWDVNYYIRIVERGYAVDDGTAQFHPLYPGLARILTLVGIPALISLSIVSSVCSVFLIIIVYRWARLDRGPKSAWLTSFLYIMSPFSAFVLFLPYSEPLFLLMASLCFCFVRRKLWWQAGLVGALATLTRQQGLLLAPSIFLAVAQSEGWSVRGFLKSWRDWMPSLLIPLAYGGWVTYRALALQDLAPNFSSVSGFIYSVLISPSAAQVVPMQSFVWPWQALGFAFQKVVRAPDLDIFINFFISTLFLGATVIAWRGMQLQEKAYTAIIIFLSFSYTTGLEHPYMGLPRHLLLAIPVSVALGKRLTSHIGRLAFVIVGGVTQMFLLLFYVLHIWVP
jgi:hypothetical protein